MPRIVRPMKKDNDDKPKVGPASKCLGVRPPGEAHPDVDVDSSGNVMQNRRGMSVTESWRKLPGHLIPEHLDDGHNGASGKNLAIFVHGQGTGVFAEGSIARGLELLLKRGRTDSGNVCPSALTPLATYQADLAATRPNWVIDES